MELVSLFRDRMYLVAHTEPKTDGCHLGIASVCTARPRSPRDVTSAVVTVRVGPYLEQVTALVIALDVAATQWQHKHEEGVSTLGTDAS